MRHRHQKGVDKQQARLNYWLNIKQKPLTDAAKTVLDMLTGETKHTQVQIAKHLKLSSARISQITTKLIMDGMLTPPPKYYRNLTKTVRDGFVKFYDVRWRAITYPLSNDVKLPHDDDGEWRASGVYNSVWHTWDSVITLKLGKKGKSLTIEAGFTEANTIPEAEHIHDEKARNIYYKLCYHFPELKDASNEYNYYVSREGEYNCRPLQPLAQELYDKYGNIKTDVVKIDASPPGMRPEWQWLTGFASKTDIEGLHKELRDIKGLQTESVGLLRELVGAIKGLATDIRALITGSEVGSPPKDLNKDDRKMYR